MNVILVASDLTARADRAVARASLLARQHGARLIGVHVVDEDLPAAVADRQRVDAFRTLEATFAALPHWADLQREVRVVVGERDRTILSEVDAAGADLVVIGAHRKDVLLDLFRGSTGERIVRFGSRPVLVVKTPALHRYASVLAAVDFSAPSRAAVELAGRFAPGADLKLVHAYDVPFRGLIFGGASMEDIAKKHQQEFQAAVEAEAAEFLARLAVPVTAPQLLVRQGMPEEAVLDAAGETRAELLVVGTHGRSGIGRALLGSVAESLIARAATDVLAVRGGA